MTGDVVAKKTIRSLLESEGFRQQIARALPRHLTPDRFIRVSVTAMMRTPELAECDQASFFNALLSLSQLGLEPDGRRAHLIPFFNKKRGVYECQLIVDYKGLVELAMRSGTIATIHADVVCENDVFQYDRGEIKTHAIDFRRPRGAMYAVYALVRMKDGTERAEVLSLAEVEAVRQRSKAGGFGPWATDYNEMAKKTAFRRLSKWLPLSPEYRDALDYDADVFPELAKGDAKFELPPLQRVEQQDQQPDQQPETNPAAHPQDDKPAQEEKPSYIAKLQQALNGDSDALAALTTFKGRDGNMVPGLRDFAKLTERRAEVAYHIWERGQKGDPKTESLKRTVKESGSNGNLYGDGGDNE